MRSSHDAVDGEERYFAGDTRPSGGERPTARSMTPSRRHRLALRATGNLNTMLSRFIDGSGS